MKFAVQCVTFLLALLACLAVRAQSLSDALPSSFPKSINHVVIIFQENRTPDNLFQGLYGQKGANRVPYDILNAHAGALLKPVGLATNFDLDHSHTAFEQELNNPETPISPICNDTVLGCAPEAWNQFMYVDNAVELHYHNTYGDGITHILDPYLALARQYGWANRMFQTNQGPSYPAHQFIFAGTSARTSSADQAAIFVAENPSSFSQTGCIAPFDSTHPKDPSKDQTYCLIYPGVAPKGSERCSPNSPQNEIKCTVSGSKIPNDPCYTPSGHGLCFTQSKVPDQRLDMGYLLDLAKITWKYYAPSAGTIWTAPNSVQEICHPSDKYTDCYDAPRSEWTKHVVLEDDPKAPKDTTAAPVLEDIINCRLASVSWVIPDGRWSDHANANAGLGPAWAAAIVNKIGQSTCPSGNWNDTAIIITWDDWGGWFDHVPPPPGVPTGDQRDYQYGFRVPLIVVSAYTLEGYVDDTNVYDFGSILKTIEVIFGLGKNPLGAADKRADNDLRAFFTAPQRKYEVIPAIQDADFFRNLKIKPHDPDND